jgi:hypothetical protein
MQQIPKPVPAAPMPAGARCLPGELALWLAHAPGVAGARRGADPGGGPDAASETRGAVLRALAQRFYPGVPVSTQAARLHALAETYAFANWPRDRERAQIPARYRGMPDEYLWAAFKSGAPMPLSQRELRRILIGAPEGEAL